jgi:2-oxoglutarate ferredoxin oxidoreductase subunit gamma
MTSQDTSIIISGSGGQGILFAGSLLCYAAVFEGKHTTWIPSYGAEMRGGAANCSVHISDDEVSSPIVNMSDIVFALNQPSFEKFAARVKPGGLLIANTSLIPIESINCKEKIFLIFQFR